ARASAGPSSSPRWCAAARPATSPSAVARSAPPTPVASPATSTPGTVLRWNASTVTTRLPSTPVTVAQPSATASATDGVNPYPTHTASTDTVRVTGPARHPVSTRRTV